MNKQTTFTMIAALAALGLAGIVVLLVLRPESTEKLMNYLFQLLILLAGFGGLAASQHQQGKAIETIKRNTNGTLSAKDAEIATLRAALAQHAPDALVEQTGAIEVQTRAQRRAELAEE